MSSLEKNQEIRCCPQCGAKNSVARLEDAQYHCPACDTELAHLDIGPSGSVRRVLGWLKSVDDVIGGRYRVKTVLGRGGFAATYLVEDLTLNGRRRALKEIPESLFDEHELQFLSRIDHPAVPDITDRLKADGMEYLVLKFGGSRTLEGERKRLNGQIPFDDHLRNWMLQLCEALEHLHSLDPPIIHRDLKPANILLDDNDRVMLIDFGIAKESNPSTKTRASGCATSHGFSSPEQEMDMGTDQRSDIYSFGATLYALLTGLTPPAASDRLLQGKPVLPPSQFAANLPPALEKTILRALDINPEHRQQTIGELVIVLEGLEPSDSKKISQRTVVLDTPRGDTHTTGSKLKSVKLPKQQTNAQQDVDSDPAAVSAKKGTTPPAHSDQAQAPPHRADRERVPVLKSTDTEKHRSKRVIVAVVALALALAGIGWYVVSTETVDKKTAVAGDEEKKPPSDDQGEMQSAEPANIRPDVTEPVHSAVQKPLPNGAGSVQPTTTEPSIKSKEKPIVTPKPGTVPSVPINEPSAVEILEQLRPKVLEPESPPISETTAKKPPATSKKTASETSKKSRPTTAKKKPVKRVRKAPARKKTAAPSKSTRTAKSTRPKAVKPTEKKKSGWTVIWKGSKKTD